MRLYQLQGCNAIFLQGPCLQVGGNWEQAVEYVPETQELDVNLEQGTMQLHDSPMQVCNNYVDLPKTAGLFGVADSEIDATTTAQAELESAGGTGLSAAPPCKPAAEQVSSLSARNADMAFFLERLTSCTCIEGNQSAHT